MSVFFCHGCCQYLDSDESGYNNIIYNIFKCDKCMSQHNSKEFGIMLQEFLDKFIKEDKNEK